MATTTPKTFVGRTQDFITSSQIWKSIFRHGCPTTDGTARSWS